MRQRGTMTEDLVKAVLIRAWNLDDPSLLTITVATTTEIVAEMSATSEEWQWTFAQTNMHISLTSEASAPDQGMAEDMIRKIKPTWENWSVGQYKFLAWGVAGAEGAWDQAVWG